VAETVDNARRQQGPCETSLTRRSSPAGYQRWHGVKDYVSTGEALGTRRRKPVEEASPITVSGKWAGRRQGGGSDRTTVDRRAAKRARREGSGPVGSPLLEVRQGDARGTAVPLGYPIGLLQGLRPTDVNENPPETLRLV